jgi:uncharacterized membrane protein
MGKGRLEAFSDGVIAVAITIMVLELKPPHDAHAVGLESLRSLLPAFFAYILSFIYVGIYWNNHHHLLHAAEHVSGGVLWANLHLLFWLTLIPFVTDWMGDTHFASWPVALYGLVLFMCGVAWQILSTILVRCHGSSSKLGTALGRSKKEWMSVILYVLGIAITLAGHWLGNEAAERWTAIAGCAIYGIVAAMWIVPDRRLERALLGEWRRPA